MNNNYSLFDASYFVWNLIWSSESETHIQLNILDVILVENNAVMKWLFTAKEGHVKCKSKRRRTKSEVVDRLRKNCAQSNDFQSDFSLSSCPEWYRIESESEVLDIFDQYPQHNKAIVTRPNGHSFSSNYIHISCVLDHSSAVLKVKTKCQNLVQFLDKTTSKIDSKYTKSPSNLIPCRNKNLIKAAHGFAIKFIEIIECKATQKLQRLVFVVMMEDVESTALDQAQTGRLWLHHVESLHFESVKTDFAHDFSDHISVVSQHSRTSAKSNCKSVYSTLNGYVKSREICFGDFCSCSAIELEDTKNAVDFNELDDVDMKTEFHEAIKRHRSTGDPRENNLALDNDKTSSTVLAFPIKKQRIIYKSIALTRKEIKQIEELYADMGDFSFKAIEDWQKFRSELSEVWPLPLAKWWLANGKLNPRNPGGGKLPSSAMWEDKFHNISDCDPYESLDSNESYKQMGIDENKWFSMFYSLVFVCDNCFINYQELETYRQSRISTLRRRNLNDSHMSEEERKKKDREIEGRIFAQRRSISKLSKCKSAPSQLESSNVDSGKISAMKRNLPPLPWSNTYGNDFQLRSVADHIMKKTLSSNFDNYDADLLHEWKEAITPLGPVKTTATPQINLRKDDKPKISIKNYSVERLLHPWQRGVDELRKEAQNRHKQSEGNFTIPQQLNTIHESDTMPSYVDEDSDDEVLGLNPFVITLDHNNRVSIINT